MTTTLATTIEYPVADCAIAELHDRYMPLVVQGIDDREGLAAVHDARMHVKGLRVDVEKRRKALKADALEYGRTVDAEAKRLTGLLLPIEGHLESQEKAVEAEKARRKREEAERKAAVLRDRMGKLTAVECVVMPTEVEAMSDERFADVLAVATRRFERKQAEAAAEAERQRAEQAALDAERRKLEVERRRLAEEQAALQAAKDKAEAEKRAAAEESARKAAEEAREQEREATRPDREKLRAVAEQLRKVKVPAVSASADALRDSVVRVLGEAAKQIESLTA